LPRVPKRELVCRYRMSFAEYLTIDEVAVRLKIKSKTVRNKMSAGIFKKGVHYFHPKGLGPRFKWSAILALAGIYRRI
jgi:hypothetical protein